MTPETGVLRDAPPNECVEAWSNKAPGDPAYVPHSSARSRLDADRHVVTVLNGAGHPLLAWRYDAEKRLVAYIGFDVMGGSGRFQHDYVRDAHGNTTDFRLSYPAVPSLDVPSSAKTSIGRSSTNTYDANGALVSSLVHSYGGGLPPTDVEYRYRENAAGQCDQITVGTQVETRLYDAEGRLVRSETRDPSVPPGGWRCNPAAVTKTWRYDDQGRLVESRHWCQNSADGSEGSRVRITYFVDGSSRRESYDAYTDLTIEALVQTERSAYCAVLDKWRTTGAVGSARCRTD